MPQRIIVDRENEQELFRKIVSGETTQNILFVSGEGGMGKSVLLRLFLKICTQHNVKTVSFDLKTGAFDLSEFATRISNTFGVQNFPHYQKQINSLISQSVNVDENVLFGSREIQLSLGGLSQQRRLENQQLITDAIFIDLANLAQEKPIAVFFDTYEGANSEFAEGLSYSFLNHASKLRNLIIVIAGRLVPKINNEWENLLIECQLAPIQAEYWMSYAQQLAIPVSKDFIFGATTALTGNPLQMAMLLSAIDTSEGGK